MKFCLIVISLFVIFLTLATAVQTKSNSTTIKPKTTKEQEKLSYPKKVSSSKKNVMKTTRKKIADITEKFKDLSADDLEFIKELDRQFKQHGGKVKIKVENKNITESKTSKRTIDGELGYGYQSMGYNYDPPKFMFYPYSQQDIAGSSGNYHQVGDGKTEVSIEPSYSYELQPQSYITHQHDQQIVDVPKQDADPQHYHSSQQQYNEPVIVLRIPGPAKYATHLQSLLQQYLEIRATQYLRILEEAEHRNHYQQQDHHHQQQDHQLQQLDYGHGGMAIPEGYADPVEQHQHHHHQQEQQVAVQEHEQVKYDHQIAVTPQPVLYPEIDDVYHGYKHRHSGQPEPQPQQPVKDTKAFYGSQESVEEHQAPQYEHQQQYQPQVQYQHQEQPQFYYTHQQQYAQPEGPPVVVYQNGYLPPQGQAESQPIYVPEQQIEHEPSSAIAENNPRSTHTKVVFTNNKEHSQQDYQMYELPSIKPNERHPPNSVPDYHQDYQQQQYQSAESQESSAGYSQPYNPSETSNVDVVSVTPRPYNYHANGIRARARGRTVHARRSVTASEADSRLEKIREYVRDKLGAETGSAVEFQTTQVIEP